MGLIKIVGDDPFDPNNWVEDDHEFRIYADETLEVYAVVDCIDYPYLSQFKWSIHTKQVGGGRLRPQLYLRRTVTEFFGPDGEPFISEFTGRLTRNRKRIAYSRFLHQDVMQRKGDVPLTPAHKIIDHKDKKTMNCRRNNLRWATHSENKLNDTPRPRRKKHRSNV